MRSLTDMILSNLNVWLQWIAIIGTGLGLLSGIGLVFIRKEISDRQAMHLSAALKESANAKSLASSLQRAMQPRHLSSEQRLALLARLKTAPKGTITLMAIKMDNEATAFANEVGAMLRDAGFTVTPYSGPLILSMSPGIWLSVHSVDNPPLHAHPLQEAFRAVGMPCVLGPNPEVPQLSVLLGIGPKQ